jgi:hypothetical protein
MKVALWANVVKHPELLSQKRIVAAYGYRTP